MIRRLSFMTLLLLLLMLNLLSVSLSRLVLILSLFYQNILILILFRLVPLIRVPVLLRMITFYFGLILISLKRKVNNLSGKGNLSFSSAYSFPVCCFTSPGELTRPEYRDKVFENGYIGVEEVGKIDLDGMIQSSRDECLIYNILERAVSDPQVLSQFNGQFVDVTKDQVSLAQHLQRAIDLQADFDKLPFQIRKMFDNDLHTFIEKLRDGSADSLVSEYISAHSSAFIKPKVDSSKSEVINANDSN